MKHISGEDVGEGIAAVLKGKKGMNGYPMMMAMPSESSNAPIWILLGIVVLAGGGVGVYFLGKNQGWWGSDAIEGDLMIGREAI